MSFMRTCAVTDAVGPMPGRAMRDLIVLFRGVNVGGHRKLPMADLRKAMADAGFDAPRSYIQSGNVVVGTARDPKDVAGTIRSLVEENFGFAPDMMLLTRPELAQAVAECPYNIPGADPSRVHLFFHIGDPVSLDGLKPAAGDQARLSTGQLAHYMDTPDGMSKSKLAELVSRRLKDRATGRNLRTCLKLLELAE